MGLNLRIALPAQKLAVAVLGCVLALQICSVAQATERQRNGERYFIDFRARPSTYIGHTYIVYGRVDASGRVVEKHHAGLIPEENVWNGIFAPIRASIRKAKEDTSQPPSAIYRREMTAAEFRRVGRAVRYLKANAHQWHVIFFNCNDFGIEIAETLGLARPPSLLPPRVWVNSLRALNEH